MLNNVNTNSDNQIKYIKHNDQSWQNQNNCCSLYQYNQSFSSCLQLIYHNKFAFSSKHSFFEQSSDEDYINYADKYDYNYKENLYSENIKKDTLKQAYHDDIITSISSLNSELIYHVNTFHMYTVINIYSCCLCKMTFEFNNKLHQHI